MKSPKLIVLASLMPVMLAQADISTNSPLLGFGHEAAVKQHVIEAQFDASLQRKDMIDWMQRLTSRPHHLGSPADKDNAEFIAAQFRSWGYETAIEEFEVLFPTPKTRVLELVSPEKFTAALAETPVKEDPTSALVSEQLPTYNAYSADGDVTAPLVYVNYGVPRDYEILAENGIDVKGCIVIARYGGSWRGIKPKVAAEHGAVGCIIYSDPRDDGYYEGDVYPKGSWRNETGAQRGSVADMPVYAGDPLTPGVGATKDAKRLSMKDAASLARIPVLPISYGDALPLLKALEGPVAPDRWRGALPITYHLGPGPAKVHLKLEFNWNMTPLYDVVAKMAGSELPDEWIIRGNHEDAWVCGAEDPISGAVALLEEARTLAELARNGWKPRRTIVFTVWDGEEPGLLGSTEWVETHAEELRQKAAVYVNTDNIGRGFLHVGGSHTLEKFINEIAREVIDPERKITVGERLLAHKLVSATPSERRELRARADFRIDALGSGSDYTPFLQHLGISSLNIGFGGEDSGGSYHSIYDSFDHYTRFLDPNLDYCQALAQFAGRVVMRLADADVLPFEFNNFSDTIGRYVGEVSKLVEEMREETEEMNRMIADKTLLADADPKFPYFEPKPKPEVPHLNFAPLKNALSKLEKSAHEFESARKKTAGRGQALAPGDRQKALDEILMKAERVLIHPEGLPRRPWYAHMIYAPGLYTGYGVKTLPGVREAIEQRNWGEAAAQIEIAWKTISKFAEEIDRARELAAGASRSK